MPENFLICHKSVIPDLSSDFAAVPSSVNFGVIVLWRQNWPSLWYLVHTGKCAQFCSQNWTISISSDAIKCAFNFSNLHPHAPSSRLRRGGRAWHGRRSAYFPARTDYRLAVFENCLTSLVWCLHKQYHWIAIRSNMSPNLEDQCRSQSGLGFNGAQMIYFLIFRNIQTTKNCQNWLTNLQQPRRINARKSHLSAIESQPWLAIKLVFWPRTRAQDYFVNFVVTLRL